MNLIGKFYVTYTIIDEFHYQKYVTRDQITL